MNLASVGEWWMWAGFLALVLVLITIDLLVLQRKGNHRVSVREAAGWSALWVTVALLFNGALWWYMDGAYGRAVADEKALEFLTGYLIEKALAVDNIFVFLMIFGYFSIPAELQRRVLVYGIFGAIVMRATMILLGAWLIAHFHWILYLFGAFLLVTGVRMLFFADHQPDFAKNPILKWISGHMKITEELQGEHFFVWKDGVRFATPMFLALVLIEVSDLIFAVDSIPAIFAVTSDPFIVFTSNIFAILGLRAMYFLLADVAHRFHLLKYGLALVLAFIGVKMLIAAWVTIPIVASLGIVAGIITGAVVLSLMNPMKVKEESGR